MKKSFSIFLTTVTLISVAGTLVREASAQLTSGTYHLQTISGNKQTNTPANEAGSGVVTSVNVPKQGSVTELAVANKDKVTIGVYAPK